jgi:hypothetical protein
MTQEELNSIIKQKYENLGIPSATAERFLESNVMPVYVPKEPSSPAIVNKLQDLKTSSNFSFEPPKAKKENAVAATRAKKEDIINALLTFLGSESTLADPASIQEGKAGAIMFKNLSGDYFTLKLTLNKTKPTDFIE